MILSSVRTDQKPGSRADAMTPMDNKESSCRSAAALEDAADSIYLKSQIKCWLHGHCTFLASQQAVSLRKDDSSLQKKESPAGQAVVVHNL